MLWSRLALVPAALFVATIALSLFPSELPSKADPSVVEYLFDNRLVVWAGRLLLLSGGFVLASGGIFVVLSILARTRDGDWLKRAGPFEISEANLGELRRQLTYWQATAADLEEQVRELSEDS